MSSSSERRALWTGRICGGSRGQAVVEAALLIPLLLLLLLILAQPCILLYNQMVMQNAAAESCRLLATKVAMGAHTQEKYEGYVKRRLAAIPPVDIFHIHGNRCSWNIHLQGDSDAERVSVRIENKVKPLPILNLGAAALGALDSQGNLTQVVQVETPTQPLWYGRQLAEEKGGR